MTRGEAEEQKMNKKEMTSSRSGFSTGKRAGLLCLATLCCGSAASAANQETTINFKISNGEVVPKDQFAAKIRVLGAAITYGGKYDEMVTVQVHVGKDDIDPFGPHDLAVDGNVNDGKEHHVVLGDTYKQGQKITVTGTSWIMPGYNGGVDPSDNSSWALRRQRNSHAEKKFVITLRDGDEVPQIEAFMNQLSIEDFIGPYIDTRYGTVVLGDNQAIFLFELGAADAKSPTIDFQDLVVLVTLGNTPAEASLLDVPALIAD